MTPFPLAASSLATLAAVLLEDSVGAPTKRGVTALHPLSQAREGDDLMAFSSFLRERYGLLFDDEEAEAAEQLYRKARLCKEALDKNGTIHRFFHSHGYRKVAEKALKGIWTASVKTRLMLMSEDGAVPHDASDSAPGAGDVPKTTGNVDGKNPLADPRPVDGSIFGDAVTAFSLEVYQSTETNENVAVVKAETPGQDPSFAVLALGTAAASDASKDSGDAVVPSLVL